MKRLFTLVILTIFSFSSYSQWNTPTDHEAYCSHMNRFDHQERTLEYLYDWQSDYLNDYDVTFYFLDITVSNTTTYIEGNTTINALAVTVVDTFAFELIPLMTISQVIINDVDYTDVFYRDGSSNNVLVPIEEIAEGEMISAQIFYSGTPDGGSFFVGVDNGYSPAWQKYMTWTLSEPFAASDWFAVKQDLEDKADSCWVFLTTSSENMAGSQGILTDVVDLGDGNTRYEWKSNYPIDYYLISFAVSEYQDYSIYAYPEEMNGDSVLIQNFIYDSPGCLEYYQSQASIDATPEMLELLSDLYILYPFHEEKYGHCLTRLGGGMEHQTMSTMGGFSFGLVAHELGHMWFGDNVTCATWSDIWINEGFATYSDYLCRYYLQSPSSGTSFIIEKQNSSISSSGGSVYIPEDEIFPGNEWRIFDGRLSYNKGAAIIHTLRHEIQNDELFFEVMDAFQTQYTDSTATGDDFKEVAENVTGMDFNQFFDQWYYGEGYPIYDFEWYATDNGYFHLTSSQSTSSNTPLFEMLMDFKLVFTDATEMIISLKQTQNLNEFEVYLGKTVASVQVDPNHWTMEKTNSLVVGMEETDKPIYFTIGPNPVNDHMNIYFLNTSSEVKEVTLTDISGKIILRTNTNNQQLQLDTSSLNNGIFIVTVSDGNDVLVKRFVK